MTITKAVRPNDFVGGEVAVAAEVDQDLNELYTKSGEVVDNINAAEGSLTSVAARLGVSQNLDGTLKTQPIADAYPTIEADRIAAEAARVGAELAETNAAADAVTTAADLVATNQDTIDTAADAVATAADQVQTGLDLVQTNQDTIDTAADLVQTNQDTIDTAADLVQTNQDTIDTAADVVATALNAAAAAASADSMSMNFKIIEIGDWDMDALGSVNVAHGLSIADIRSATFIIRDDLGFNHTPLGASASGVAQLGIDVTTTNVVLIRTASGIFDNTGYDSTSYNRGWVVVGTLTTATPILGSVRTICEYHSDDYVIIPGVQSFFEITPSPSEFTAGTITPGSFYKAIIHGRIEAPSGYGALTVLEIALVGSTSDDVTFENVDTVLLFNPQNLTDDTVEIPFRVETEFTIKADGKTQSSTKVMYADADRNGPMESAIHTDGAWGGTTIGWEKFKAVLNAGGNFPADLQIRVFGFSVQRST